MSIKFTHRGRKIKNSLGSFPDPLSYWPDCPGLFSGPLSCWPDCPNQEKSLEKD